MESSVIDSWKYGLSSKLHLQLEHSEFLGSRDVDPLTLVSTNRFDILIKLRCIHLFDHGGYELAQDLYLKHIKKINQFWEADGSKKGPGDFWQRFLDLYTSYKKEGFSSEKSIIPVDENNVIIDGAHRVAFAIYFNYRVRISRFKYCSQISLGPEKFSDMLENFQFFSILSTYLEYDSDKRLLIAWPKVFELNKDKLVSQKLNNEAIIYFQADIKLTINGLRNFMINVYQNEPWVGGIENRYQGIEKKFLACKSSRDQILSIYLISANNLLQLKENLREAIGISNHSLHSTDFSDDTLKIVNLLSCKESLFSLNCINLRTVSPFALKLIKEFSPPKKDFSAITSSLVLSLFIFREPEDCDFLSLQYEFKPSHKLISNHHTQLKYYSKNLASLILSDESCFYFLDKKFISLSEVHLMKYKRMELKDTKDILRLGSLKPSKYKFKALLHLMKYVFSSLAKDALTVFTASGRKKIYHNWVYCIFSLLPFSTRFFRYAGFWMKSDKRNLIVKTISNGEIYKKTLSKKIVLLLKKDSILVDIGANIGLVSFFAIKKSEVKKVYAFEPESKLYKFLKENVLLNSLEGKIAACNIAFTSKEVFEEMPDVSNNGAAESVFHFATLDNYFSGQQLSRIDLIKIYSPGLELSILEGGQEVLNKFRPKIIIELEPGSCQKYKHKREEIFNFLESHSYQICSLDEQPLALEEFRARMESDFVFLAVSSSEA